MALLSRKVHLIIGTVCLSTKICTKPLVWAALSIELLRFLISMASQNELQSCYGGNEQARLAFKGFGRKVQGLR